jgi:hypothetical protein
MVEQEILPRLRERFRCRCAAVSASDHLWPLGKRTGAKPRSAELPPGVVMGYRSSMPIIELKLTGPAEQREAMLALWPEVQKVAGESMIFEGTEGLPAQIARRLQERQLSLTLSEQFTGGLLALQLSRANAPLLASEVVPAQEETLAQSARWAAERRETFCRSGAGGERPGERSPELCAGHAGRHPRAAGEIQRHPPQPGGASGSLRHDGIKHAASLAEWPAGGQRTWLD